MNPEDEMSGLSTSVWASFGDLMSGLVGAFVLLLMGVMAVQLDMAGLLQREIAQREAAQLQNQSLERVLAVPLSSGRITLQNGRIGISSRVLFDLNSDRLQPQGRELLHSLVLPLKTYLSSRNELLMVSGFTDDQGIRQGNRRFEDNWELSAQRALTVTRSLIEEGMPEHLVFAAAFGQQQPIQPNDSEKNRSLNRRVELAPIPRAGQTTEHPVTNRD
jgi:flagellar motor protein MotB